MLLNSVPVVFWKVVWRSGTSRQAEGGMQHAKLAHILVQHSTLQFCYSISVNKVM